MELELRVALSHDITALLFAVTCDMGRPTPICISCKVGFSETDRPGNAKDQFGSIR